MSTFQHIRPDERGIYSVKLLGLGIYVTAGLDGDGRPYVAVNTDYMRPEFVYDEHTGLRGTAEPFVVEPDGASYRVVNSGSGERVALHYPQPDSGSARRAAQRHANALNEAWSEQCGMPIISVHLGDAVLYDAADHLPSLREEEEKV